MVLEVMCIWRLTLANLSQSSVDTNITGSQFVEKDDIILGLQEDIKSFSKSYQISENRLYSANVKTAAYTLTNSDNVIFVDTTTTAITVTLPTAVGRRGKWFTIKDWAGNANARNITVATTSAETIDGGTLTITTNYGFRTVVSDNVNWFIIGS